MDITITLEQQDWWRFQRYVERELPKQYRTWFDGFWGSMLTWMVMGVALLWAFNQVSEFHWPSALIALLVFVFIWLLAILNMRKLRRALEPSATG
ncbi:hypothetical protein [Pseudoalteromonas sp. T1lg48]|uniref:hypothetical protein n=1 Tax=Pseudoalteromonas sp. T1lg48 TaxID=2077100 RepID=UPI000CF61E55|nr:hypothetical protein [Pseudoalteromonas sp. T1lg48]